MKNAIDYLYPFDKGFFGSTMAQHARRIANIAVNPSKLRFDSIDDFNRYYHFPINITHPKLEKTPAKDTYAKRTVDSLSDLYSNM